MLGDQAYSLALPWTVLTVTGDPGKMAVVLTAGVVPRTLLLLVGGVLADRLTPRLVMLAADLGRVAVVGGLGMTLLFRLPPLWILALFAELEGAGNGLFLPGSQALLSATLGEGGGDTMFLTIMQQRIAPEYLGRVFSLQFLAGASLSPSRCWASVG